MDNGKFKLALGTIVNKTTSSDTSPKSQPIPGTPKETTTPRRGSRRYESPKTEKALEKALGKIESPRDKKAKARASLPKTEQEDPKPSSSGE